MRVSRLEIFGFKSFVERFSLAFDENLIGVVGPNGCGKSNIVDALRWVLGETHAKQLRGSKQEDLIFNGSDSRRPLGMAEVTITIRPSEGWARHALEQQDELLALLDEEGEEPAGEDALVPLEETAETASGPQSVHEARPQDQDQAVRERSEQAGQPARSNGHAAEQILQSRLGEIPGLFNSSEIQLTRRLYRSGESEYYINRVPCRLRDMTDIYRLIGLGSRGLNIVQQGQIGQLISKKPVERRELLEEAAGISGFRTKLEAAARKLDRTSDNIARLKDIIIEVDKQVRILKRQANRARTRNELKENLRSADLQLFEAKASKILLKRRKDALVQDSLTAEVDAKRSALARLDADHTALQAEMEHFDIDLVGRRTERDAIFAKLNTERERLQQLEKQLVRCDAELLGCEEQQQELERRSGDVDGELANCDSEQQGLEQQQVQLQEQLHEAEQSLERLREAVAEELAAIESQATAELQAVEGEGSRPEVEALQQRASELALLSEGGDAVEEQQRELRGRLRSLRDSLQQKLVEQAAFASEAKTLEEQQRKIAQHMAAAAADASLPTEDGDLLQTLAAAMNVPAEAEAAVQAALGEKGGFVISERAADAGRRYAASGGSDREKVGMIFRAPRLQPPEAVLSGEERQAVPEALFLADMVQIDSDYRPLLNILLEDTVLVPSLTAAFMLQEAGAAAGVCRRMIVSANGEVLTPWGWYTSKGSSVGYSFARRLEELAASNAELDTEIAVRRQECEQLEQEDRSLAEQVEGFKRYARELGDTRRQLAEALQEDRRRAQQSQQAIRDEERKQRNAAIAREREAQAGINALKSEMQRIAAQLEFVERSRKRLFAEQHDIAEKRRGFAERLAELQHSREQIRRDLDTPATDAGRQQLEAELGEVEAAVRELEERRNAHSLRVAEAAQHYAEQRRELERLSEHHGKAALAIEKSDLELQMLLEEISRLYGEECRMPDEQQVEAVLKETGGALESRIAELQEEAGALRRRLEREGEVDPESIERYAEEKERLEGLQTQCADLEAAGKTLDRTIRRLKDLSRTRFLATFKDVSRRFEELTPRLFGGGAGHMTLIDPEDPLSSGVEISVRPPGKRLGSMELLSGGEKALVATAVLIAMFLHRPSPVCVLDEVDAPLDDANLDRFISLVREIADRTQFLVITHNKATMAAMDRLLGITMQESGVSTALHVTIAEAEEELERWTANA